MATLASVDWGRPAEYLLESARRLKSGVPAVMHIRHTARTGASKSELTQVSKFDGRALLSTPLGIQASIEFGSSLPKDREYTLFHTYMDRARETAEGIHRGIIDAGGRAEIGGKIPYATVLDWEANNRWLQSKKWFPEDGAYSSACQWLAGLVPKTIIRSSGEFAGEIARINMENLKGAPSNAFHIYVSHDTWILALIFHWFGVPPYADGVRYLEGFLLQVGEDGLNVWLRDRNELFELPYWWPGSN